MLPVLSVAALAFAPPTLRPAAVAPRATRSVSPSMLAPADWQRPVLAALLATTLALTPLEANAARGGRMGGRVGGRAPVSRMRAPSGPGMRPSTNVMIMPGMGMGYGGYGMGYPGMGYGFGLSPGGAGLYLGLSFAETLLREQQRQAFLEQQLRTQQELGRDQAAIESLSRELAEQRAKVNSLNQQGAQLPPGSQLPAGVAPGAATDSEAIMLLKQQLAKQAAEIEQLKALEKAK